MTNVPTGTHARSTHPDAHANSTSEYTSNPSSTASRWSKRTMARSDSNDGAGASWYSDASTFVRWSDRIVSLKTDSIT